MAEKQEAVNAGASYAKAQILTAEKYGNRRDLLGAILQDREYSLEEVDAEIEKFKKGKVK